MSDGGQGFGRFPVSLITSGKWASLGHAEMAVLGVLIARANGAGCAWPSTDTIAEEGGIARGNATRAIARLIDAGLLERVKAGGGRARASVYRVVEVEVVGKNRRAGASDSGENRRAGASDSGEKLTRRGPETDALAHTNRRAGASGTYKEQTRTAPAPETPASERRVRAWLTEDRKHRLTAARAAMTPEAVAAMRGAGFPALAAAVDAGVVMVTELDERGPEELAGMIVERIGAYAGALVRSGA